MSQFQDFPVELWNKIYATIDEAHANNLPKIAVFDADGTLWHNDAGNAFFDYEILNQLLPLPENPWEFVYSMKAKNPNDAFLWLAQIHKGLPLSTVKSWAQQSYQKNKIEYFPAIKNCIRLLKENDFDVYVVTASVKWAVEPCVSDLGIPEDHVLGFQTYVENGIITDIQAGHSTYKEGKAKALLEKTQGKPPLISCGNTMGDYWILDLATHLPLAVRCSGDGISFQDHDIHNQERILYEEAIKNSWYTHNFLT